MFHSSEFALFQVSSGYDVFNPPISNQSYSDDSLLQAESYAPFTSEQSVSAQDFDSQGLL